MISSQEAFLKSTRSAANWAKVCDDIPYKIIRELMERTQAAIDDGEFKVATCVEETNYDSIKEYLESLGYKVNMEVDRYNGYADITWEWEYN